MLNKLVSITAVILSLLSIQELNACSCKDFSLDLPLKELGLSQHEEQTTNQRTDLVFRGILIDQYTVTENYMSVPFRSNTELKIEMVFSLTKMYKGDESSVIKIRTNNGSAACGFYAPLNTECLIFANRSSNGFYHTLRSDCCKSTSKVIDETRYTKYVNFIESILNGIDGNYEFKQSKRKRTYGNSDKDEDLDLLSYKILNGKLHGMWKLTDRNGNILEIGKFDNGEKTGEWKFLSKTSFGTYEIKKTEEKFNYSEGRLTSSESLIEETKFNSLTLEYELIKRQRIRNTIDYF